MRRSMSCAPSVKSGRTVGDHEWPVLGDHRGELKREAGVQGAGTRIDIYAHTLQHDLLITIKKGLSEQKI